MAVGATVFDVDMPDCPDERRLSGMALFPGALAGCDLYLTKPIQKRVLPDLLRQIACQTV